MAGRFEHGIVQPGAEADRLREEIQQRLGGLMDPQHQCVAVQRVHQSTQAYRGPYRDRAPDLIVGYAGGHRVSWEAAMGRMSREVFHDRTKAWSGDHCVDPSVVPGVLFCNRAIEADRTRLVDVAPTVLEVFGIPVSDYMGGQAWWIGRRGDGEPEVVSPRCCTNPQPRMSRIHTNEGNEECQSCRFVPFVVKEDEKLESAGTRERLPQLDPGGG